MFKKTQNETIIVCKEREFKQRCVNFMNNIAFHAEKTVLETLDEAEKKLSTNPRILNAVIDGRELNIEEDFPVLQRFCENINLMILVFLGSNDEAKIWQAKADAVPNLFISCLPFNNTAFNEAFHGSRRKPGDLLSTSTSAGGGPAPAAVPGRDMVAFAASSHVRASIAMINELNKDKKALDQLKGTGQCFAAMASSFGSHTAKAGYKELRDLAQVIITIDHYYQKQDSSSGVVSEEHFTLLVGAAKCSYRLLQALRDRQPLAPDLLLTAAECCESSVNLFKDPPS